MRENGEKVPYVMPRLDPKLAQKVWDAVHECRTINCTAPAQGEFCARCREELEGEYVTLWQVLKGLFRRRERDENS